MFSVANETLLKGLKAISDNLNLAMLRTLMDGPATASELAGRFQCTLRTVWRHLEELCGAGLVQRQNRSSYKSWGRYVALKDKVRALLDGAMQFINSQELPG